jgi:hypothetical protein
VQLILASALAQSLTQSDRRLATRHHARLSTGESRSLFQFAGVCQDLLSLSFSFFSSVLVILELIFFFRSLLSRICEP